MPYESDSSSGVLGGMGLADTVFIVFLILKLIKVIDWSWWWVTAPIWGQFAFAILGIFIYIVYRLIYNIIHKVSKRKNVK